MCDAARTTSGVCPRRCDISDNCAETFANLLVQSYAGNGDVLSCLNNLKQLKVDRRYSCLSSMSSEDIDAVTSLVSSMLGGVASKMHMPTIGASAFMQEVLGNSAGRLKIDVLGHTGKHVVNVKKHAAVHLFTPLSALGVQDRIVRT